MSITHCGHGKGFCHKGVFHTTFSLAGGYEALPIPIPIHITFFEILENITHFNIAKRDEIVCEPVEEK